MCIRDSLDSLLATPKPAPEPERLLAFTFDDFNPSDYQLAFPALREYGVCGTSYAHTEPITAERWAWAREMVAAGWDIPVSYTHLDVYKRQVLKEVFLCENQGTHCRPAKARC